jgi:hypothetical protein
MNAWLIMAAAPDDPKSLPFHPISFPFSILMIMMIHVL